MVNNELKSSLVSTSTLLVVALLPRHATVFQIRRALLQTGPSHPYSVPWHLGSMLGPWGLAGNHECHCMNVARMNMYQ